MDEAELCSLLQTSVDGLPKEEAEVRRTRYGPNEVTFEKRGGWLRRLLSAIRNPLGVSLRFAQESRADAAAARLKAMISLTITSPPTVLYQFCSSLSISWLAEWPFVQ